MPAISNASPIIALAKIGRLQLLKNLYGLIFIPPSVKAEVVDKGKDLGAPDALEIEGAINEGWIKVAKLTKVQNHSVRRLVDRARIGLGEAGALTIARSRRMLVILDDKEARAMAKSFGLEYTSTVMVLYEAFVKKLISYDELLEDLTKLTRVMWISTDVITEVIKKAKEVVK